jgi:hypothetical protein
VDNFDDIDIFDDEESPEDEYEHEAFNLYAHEDMRIPYPSPTWWAFDEASFDRLEEAGTSLDEMFNLLGIEPVSIRRNVNRIFEARFEFPAYGNSFKHAGVVEEGSLGFIDFPIGIPFGCIERCGIVGEISSLNVIGIEGGERATPPLVEDMFRDKDGMSTVNNLIWLDKDNTKSLAPGLGVAEELEHHWWMRCQLRASDPDNSKRPTPGEFLNLVVFIFPNLSWGWQRKNPFIMSGNWMETVFYTSSKVISGADGEYTVQYRKNQVQAVASDWAQHEEGDRVAILKNVDSPESTFTWEDLKGYDESGWVIIPAVFYSEEVEI